MYLVCWWLTHEVVKCCCCCNCFFLLSLQLQTKTISTRRRAFGRVFGKCYLSRWQLISHSVTVNLMMWLFMMKYHIEGKGLSSKSTARYTCHQKSLFSFCLCVNEIPSPKILPYTHKDHQFGCTIWRVALDSHHRSLGAFYILHLPSHSLRQMQHVTVYNSFHSWICKDSSITLHSLHLHPGAAARIIKLHCQLPWQWVTLFRSIFQFTSNGTTSLTHLYSQIWDIYGDSVLLFVSLSRANIILLATDDRGELT